MIAYYNIILNHITKIIALICYCENNEEINYS